MGCEVRAGKGSPPVPSSHSHSCVLHPSKAIQDPFGVLPSNRPTILLGGSPVVRITGFRLTEQISVEQRQCRRMERELEVRPREVRWGEF